MGSASPPFLSCVLQSPGPTATCGLLCPDSDSSWDNAPTLVTPSFLSLALVTLEATQALGVPPIPATVGQQAWEVVANAYCVKQQ